MNSLSFLTHPCPIHVLLFCSKDSLSRCVPFFALWLTHALQPAVQRARADQGATNAAQAVVPQAEPQPAAEPAPQPDQLPNPPAEQLDVFHCFLVLLYLFVFVFSPMFARTLVFLVFLYPDCLFVPWYTVQPGFFSQLEFALPFFSFVVLTAVRHTRFFLQPFPTFQSFFIFVFIHPISFLSIYF